MAAARLASFGEVKDIVRSEPWCLESSGLGTWYDDHVKLGADAFDRDCRAAVDNVLETVHELCSFNNILFDIDKVVKVRFCTHGEVEWVRVVGHYLKTLEDQSSHLVYLNIIRKITNLLTSI